MHKVKFVDKWISIFPNGIEIYTVCYAWQLTIKLSENFSEFKKRISDGNSTHAQTSIDLVK